MWIFPYKT